MEQMVVNEVKNQTDDAALFIYQAGFDWNMGKIQWTLAGSYYDWSNLENSEYLHLAEYKGGGGNSFILNNGVLQYAYDYNLWEGISHVKFKLGEIPTKLIFDYVVNTADDVPDDQDTAYYLGFELGKAKKKGDWDPSDVTFSKNKEREHEDRVQTDLIFSFYTSSA